MKLKETEADVQRTILDYLHMKGHGAWRINTQGVPMWGKKQAFVGMRPSPMKGIADIIGLHKDNGLFFAIEVKSKTGKASSEQLEFLSEVRLRSGIGIVARSLEDVIDTGL